jgi:hypothetical protein
MHLSSQATLEAEIWRIEDLSQPWPKKKKKKKETPPPSHLNGKKVGCSVASVTPAKAGSLK